MSDQDEDEPVRDGPPVGTMIACVAISVALVILVFFALGYLIGRIYLG